MTNKQKMPTPAERPDLYDAYDYPVERQPGYVSGVRIPASVANAGLKPADGKIAAE